MKKLIIILLLLSPVLAAISFVVVSRKENNSAGSGVKESQPSGKVFQAQTSEEGQVVVEVKPKALEPGKEVIFEITFTTHSEELDFDLVSLAKIKDDQGKEMQAVSWSGGRGGHHLSGDLEFPALTEQTRSVELIMADIAGSDRIFKWDL